MNIGVHHGIVEKKHIEQMGQSIWLYLWCLHRQTKPNGLVLGGAPISYKRINQELGQNERTIRRWMKALRDIYLDISYLNYKQLRIRVLKPKKFNHKQIPLAMDESAKNGRIETEPSAKNGRQVRTNMADTADKNGRTKQNLIMKPIEAPTTTTMPDGIASVIPIPLWLQFVQMRRQIRKPLSDATVDLIVRKLLEFQSEGQDPIAVLEQSVMNSWAGIFPVKGSKNEITKSDARAERTDTALGRVFGKPETMAQNIRRTLPAGDH